MKALDLGKMKDNRLMHAVIQRRSSSEVKKRRQFGESLSQKSSSKSVIEVTYKPSDSCLSDIVVGNNLFKHGARGQGAKQGIKLLERFESGHKRGRSVGWETAKGKRDDSSLSVSSRKTCSDFHELLFVQECLRRENSLSLNKKDTPVRNKALLLTG